MNFKFLHSTLLAKGVWINCIWLCAVQRIVQLSLSGSGINKSTLERIVYFISFWGYKTHCSVHTNIYFQILTHILQKIIITVWWYCTFYLISHNERNIIRKESILSHWSQPVQIRIKHSRFHQKQFVIFIDIFFLPKSAWSYNGIQSLHKTQQI